MISLLAVLAVLIAHSTTWGGRKHWRRPRRARHPPPRWGPGELTLPAAVVLGAGVAVTSHPVAGAVVGLVGWWLLPAVVAELQTSQQVRLRDELTYQLPIVGGLLSACLSSGATLPASLEVVALAIEAPAGPVLAKAARTAELGGPPEEVAAVLALTGDPGWQALAAAIMRSSATGAPLADLLHEQAERALGDWFSAASVRARGVSVRIVLPLALCFLPAFVVLGVVPVVAGLLAGLDWF